MTPVAGHCLHPAPTPFVDDLRGGHYLLLMEIVVIGIIAVAAVAAVLAPIVLADRSPAVQPDGPSTLLRDPDAALARYRAAVRSGTLCERCLFANPDESRFCAECGRRL